MNNKFNLLPDTGRTRLIGEGVTYLILGQEGLILKRVQVELKEAAQILKDRRVNQAPASSQVVPQPFAGVCVALPTSHSSLLNEPQDLSLFSCVP